MVTIDVEKAFDSLDLDLLLCVFKKFGFGDNFITWIRILLNDQQSCIINGRFATQYFRLRKLHAKVTLLEVLFTLIKSQDNIYGIDLYDYSFLFTAYADDSTFFLKGIASVRILVDTFKVFSCIPGLKPNINKCEISGLGILKRAQGQSGLFTKY